MSKSYLVTGAAGFIASQVCRQLIEQGDSVVGVDNLNDDYDIVLKNWRLDQFRNYSNCTNFKFIQLDIEDQDNVENLFLKNGPFDAVLNLAARAGVRKSMENPHAYLSTNAKGTLNLLENMRIHRCSKFVLSSTSSLYAGQKTPFTEDLAANEPLSPYAATKKASELMAYTYHKLYGIDVSVLRYFTVFGPAGRPDMSPFRFIKWISEGEMVKLYGDGSQSRDFTFVDDIAAGTIAGIKEVGYEIINLGGGRNPVSLNAIISKLEGLIGKKAKIDYKPFHVADLMETWADIGKAKDLIGWQPKALLDQSLEKSVKWYIDNKNWLKEMKK